MFDSQAFALHIYCWHGMGNRVSPGCDLVSYATDMARREGEHERGPVGPLS